MAHELGITDNVLFLGHCENVLEIVSLFDLLVACSLSEGLSLAIVEAMAQGKAVVATAVGGIPEVITDGKTGLLVPANSPDKLAHAITVILKDEGLREQLGKAGEQRCRDRFLVTRAVEQLRTLYLEVSQE